MAFAFHNNEAGGRHHPEASSTASTNRNVAFPDREICQHHADGLVTNASSPSERLGLGYPPLLNRPKQPPNLLEFPANRRVSAFSGSPVLLPAVNGCVTQDVIGSDAGDDSKIYHHGLPSLRQAEESERRCAMLSQQRQNEEAHDDGIHKARTVGYPQTSQEVAEGLQEMKWKENWSRSTPEPSRRKRQRTSSPSDLVSFPRGHHHVSGTEGDLPLLQSLDSLALRSPNLHENTEGSSKTDHITDLSTVLSPARPKKARLGSHSPPKRNPTEFARQETFFILYLALNHISVEEIAQQLNLCRPVGPSDTAPAQIHELVLGIKQHLVDILQRPESIAVHNARPHDNDEVRAGKIVQHILDLASQNNWDDNLMLACLHPVTEGETRQEKIQKARERRALQEYKLHGTCSKYKRKFLKAGLEREKKVEQQELKLMGRVKADDDDSTDNRKTDEERAELAKAAMIDALLKGIK